MERRDEVADPRVDGPYSWSSFGLLLAGQQACCIRLLRLLYTPLERRDGFTGLQSADRPFWKSLLCGVQRGRTKHPVRLGRQNVEDMGHPAFCDGRRRTLWPFWLSPLCDLFTQWSVHCAIWKDVFLQDAIRRPLLFEGKFKDAEAFLRRYALLCYDEEQRTFENVYKLFDMFENHELDDNPLLGHEAFMAVLTR